MFSKEKIRRQTVAEDKKVRIVARTISVRRDFEPGQLITASGREQYIDFHAVATMPRGGNGLQVGVRVEFFQPKRDITYQGIIAEHKRRGLKPDPYAVAAVNIADPAFSGQYPNIAIWESPDGRWYHIAFGESSLARFVDIGHSPGKIISGWWYGGVRQ